MDAFYQQFFWPLGFLLESKNWTYTALIQIIIFRTKAFIDRRHQVKPDCWLPYNPDSTETLEIESETGGGVGRNLLRPRILQGKIRDTRRPKYDDYGSSLPSMLRPPHHNEAKPYRRYWSEEMSGFLEAANILKLGQCAGPQQ